MDESENVYIEKLEDLKKVSITRLVIYLPKFSSVMKATNQFECYSLWTLLKIGIKMKLPES